MSDFDRHWLPFTLSCDPCRVGYTHILKFESLSTEEPLSHKALNVNVGPTKKWNPTRKQKETEEEVTEEYFKSIDLEDFKVLYEIYEMDMRMFGYNFTFKNVIYPL